MGTTTEMSMTNAEIADIFNRIATLLELDGESFFKIRAYRQGAEAIEYLKESMGEMLEQGKKLTELEGIGKELALKIQELVETGKLTYLEKLEQKVPPSLLEIMKIPGLGVKRVRQMYDELNLLTLADVKQAAEQNKLQTLPRFGKKLEADVLRRIEWLEENG